MAPRVLISYSHDSDEHAERVLDLADRLREDGIDCRVDQYLTKGPPQGWPLWMDAELEAAEAVLVVFTERYATKSKEPKRSGVKFESVLILQELYDAGMLNEKFLPVVFESADAQHIVKWLRPYASFNVGDDAGYEKLRRRLLDDPEVEMPALGTPVKKGPRRKTSSSVLRVNIAHLPAAGPLLIGRETEMACLNAAWESASQHVISVVARGGEGKTNLVRHWLNAMSADGWRGAERVFGWSFFSQGSKEKAASADQFIDEALRFFGNTSAEAIKSPHERGDRLAQFVGSGRNLLILDGLEPLQYPPGVMEGRLKDPALQTFIAGLSAHNAGLCVITTRESLPELAAGRENVSPEIELPALTDAAGAELLQRLKVNGSNEQRAEISHRLGGHALSIQLLGTYLDEVYDGDVTRAGEVALLGQDAASRERVGVILETYERWLSGLTLSEDDPVRTEVKRSGAPMLAVLRLLGFFDRPADMELIDVLRAQPPIGGITDALVELPHAEWKRALTRLRKLKLIDDDKTAIDAHPVIREYFATRLTQEFPEGTREGHRRLYEKLKSSAPEFPETLQAMMLLYAAVRHGCKAGLWQEALDEVFFRRIDRGVQGYSWRKLGAFGAHLEAISAFTSGDYTIPTAHIRETDQAWVLGVVAFSLKALARHHETRRLMEVLINKRIQQKDWKNAATAAFNLNELYLDLGEVSSALKWAEEGIGLADETDDLYTSLLSRMIIADTLHATGVFDSALVAFQEAFKLQTQLHPKYTVLFSGQGFFYRDLALNMAMAPSAETISKIREEAETVLRLYDEHLEVNTLDYAVDHLTLARTFILENATTPSLLTLGMPALAHAEEAVSLLRNVGVQAFLLRGLLCRAAAYRTWPDLHPDSFARASKDLTEAEQVANGGGLLRWQVEAALERTRLLLAVGDTQRAREKLEKAKRLIKKTEAPYVPHAPTRPECEPPPYVNTFKEGDIVGYRRADADVAVLERELA